MEESYRDTLECTEEDITDKVVFLEKRVTELEKDTAANGEQHSRLKQENLQLVHRANALEEQLKEQELRADQTLLEEIKKQREMLSKMEREKSIEIENLQARWGRAGGVVAGLLGTWITSNQCRPRGLAASPPFPLSQNQAPPPAWPQTARISPLGFQFSSCSPSTAVPCSV